MTMHEVYFDEKKYIYKFYNIFINAGFKGFKPEKVSFF